MLDIVQMLRDRRITGLNSSSDPQSFSVEVSETTDFLCIAAAEEIERLKAEIKLMEPVVNAAIRFVSPDINRRYDPSYELKLLGLIVREFEASIKDKP